MRKFRIIAAALAAIITCGCSENSENSSVPVYTVIQSSSSSSSTGGTSSSGSSGSGSSSTSSSNGSSSSVSESSYEASSTENDLPTAENPTFSSNEDDGKIPYEERSSTGVVWDPLSTNLTYDFNSADIIKGLEERYGQTGADLGYTGEWCAEIVSDLLIKDGYRISKQYNPCDVAIQLLNKGYAHFYCFREENFDSLVQYGLKKSAQSRVIMTDREDFTPQRGDFVCFLWNEENTIYNWSHIGMVAEDYDGTVLRTIEGNIGVAEFPDDPRIRTVDGREREYNETVIGIIRLDK
ncbi:MAG: CHAP domain-containing protein [Oscillospiraceae bacterium]